jgi:hypothetical protein
MTPRIAMVISRVLPICETLTEPLPLEDTRIMPPFDQKMVASTQSQAKIFAYVVRR